MVTSELAVQSVFANKLFLLNLKLPNALSNVSGGLTKESPSLIIPQITLSGASTKPSS